LVLLRPKHSDCLGLRTIETPHCLRLSKATDLSSDLVRASRLPVLHFQKTGTLRCSSNFSPLKRPRGSRSPSEKDHEKVSLFNNKGGVGKTSLLYHLAHMSALRGQRVVAADLDPQANLSGMFLQDDRIETLWSAGGAATVYSAMQPDATLDRGHRRIHDRPGTVRRGRLFQLARHDEVLAEGLSTESYLNTGNRWNFEMAAGRCCCIPTLSTACGTRWGAPR
jgi:hypothetical protein